MEFHSSIRLIIQLGVDVVNGKTVSKFKKVLTAMFKAEETAPQTRKEFYNACAKSNRFPALVILSMALTMESMMVILYVLDTYLLKKAKFFPQYIYLYTSMILMSSILILLFNLSKFSRRKLMQLELATLGIIGIWSAVFSAYDVINGFSSYLFVQLMMIDSLLFRVNSKKHCVINAGSFLIYMVIILFHRLNIIITFAELINPFLMMVAACIIIILNSRLRLKAYINQQVIKEQNKKLAFYADNDFLTKIPNHKKIIECLDELIKSDAKNITCMMLDIDNFKLYNDTYGHIAGDSCLTALAAVIERNVLSHGGKVGRYGGEEFLVLLKEKEKDCILSIANGLVQAVREQSIEFPANSDFPVVTISCGVHIEREATNADRNILIAYADLALYQSKREGKNKISIYPEE
jgi:diguanylate cyclase (GGDEF)-like protein